MSDKAPGTRAETAAAGPDRSDVAARPPADEWAPGQAAVERPTADTSSTDGRHSVSVGLLVLLAIGAVALVGGYLVGQRVASEPAMSGPASGSSAAADVSRDGTRAAAAPPDTGGLSVGVVRSDEASLGEPAPPFELPTADGRTLALSDLAGQPVVLNFWATWCVPCRIEMPYLQAAHEAYAERGLVVLGVDVGEDVASAAAFMDELGLTFPTVVDARSEVAGRYRVSALPTTYFIRTDGTVARVHRGVLAGQAQLERELATILPTDGSE